MLGEKLAEAAAGNSEAVLGVRELLRPTSSPNWRRYDLIQNLPVVLASALDGPSPDLRQRASALMDRLGREGETELAHQVQQARKELPTRHDPRSRSATADIRVTLESAT